MKAMFENCEPRTIPKEPYTCAMEPRDRSSFPKESIFGVPRRCAAPPVDMQYPHWSDPLRLAECHFFDPPPRFEPPQARKTPKVSGSQTSESTRASTNRASQRNGSCPDSRKSGHSRGGPSTSNSAGSRDSHPREKSAPLSRKNLTRHVRETKPWGGSNAPSDNNKDKRYFASIESVYEIRMGCRKLDGTPIAHGRAGVPSAKLRDEGWRNFYNNPEHGGPYYKPKTFGYSGGPQPAGISTGALRAHG